MEAQEEELVKVATLVGLEAQLGKIFCLINHFMIWHLILFMRSSVGIRASRLASRVKVKLDWLPCVEYELKNKHNWGFSLIFHGKFSCK